MFHNVSYPMHCVYQSSKHMGRLDYMYEVDAEFIGTRETNHGNIKGVLGLCAPPVKIDGFLQRLDVKLCLLACFMYTQPWCFFLLIMFSFAVKRSKKNKVPVENKTIYIYMYVKYL